MRAQTTAEWGYDRDALYQRLDERGELRVDLPAGLQEADIIALYEWMRTLRLIDERMQRLQRQGRISFYGACTGQEAAVLGTGSALRPTDWVFPALREGGILLLRGHDFSQYVAQLFGNAADRTLGRQMPCHYNSRELRFVSLSSPIATQLPQAVGAAMAVKLRDDDAVVAAYMGDGATSEGDFHTALQWAGRMKLPVVFVCQNNQWAISVPSSRQSRARNFAAKAPAYGMVGARVDGNDVIACWDAMRRAVDRARTGHGPVFLEALTYRIGAHSTSDDPSRYRDEAVTEEWKKRCPIERLGIFLRRRHLWDDDRERALVQERDRWIKQTVEQQEAVGRPDTHTLFTDVFAELPPHLREQSAELQRSLGSGPSS